MRLIAASALLALALAPPALAETSVGVTAAVNQDATGTVGSNVRTISLGDSVVFNQRIQTGGSGLVQVLLADGTTFMVGPNSDLVIDSFVYDPNAGTAQVTASFTKGVLRFIGGQTSKTEGGVTINTPVGTMGIRGAMVDVVLDPPEGTPPHVDMLFGNEVTLERGKELLGRLYASGYSLALGDGGVFDVLKTPPAWGSQIQGMLAGKLGTSGGAAKGPSDSEVKGSDVANKNSGNGVDKNSGNKQLTKEELAALLYAAAHYDELRNFILNNNFPQGFVGGTFVGANGSDEWLEEDYTQQAPGITDFDDEWVYDDENDVWVVDSYEPTFAKFAFDENGNPIGIQAAFLASFSCECEDNDVEFVYTGSGAGGQIAIRFPDDDEPMLINTTNNYLFAYDDPREDNPLSQEVVDHDLNDLVDEQILADRLECENCAEFVRWGFWGFTANEAAGIPIEGGVDYMGTYITGDLTTRAQLNNLADLDEGNVNAFYTGDAVGVVHNDNPVGTETDYVATGDLLVTWSFGARQGTVDITEFDEDNANLNLTYNVGSVAGAPGFVGYLDAEGNQYGTAQGAFVNTPNEIAGGVIGTFDYATGDGYYPDYTVGGVFMGEHVTPN